MRKQRSLTMGISLLNARKLKNLQKQMEQAVTYEEWSESAQQHDEISGQKRWRGVDKTSQYDYCPNSIALGQTALFARASGLPGAFVYAQRGYSWKLGRHGAA